MAVATHIGACAILRRAWLFGDVPVLTGLISTIKENTDQQVGRDINAQLAECSGSALPDRRAVSVPATLGGPDSGPVGSDGVGLRYGVHHRGAPSYAFVHSPLAWAVVSATAR